MDKDDFVELKGELIGNHPLDKGVSKTTVPGIEDAKESAAIWDFKSLSSCVTISS